MRREGEGVGGRRGGKEKRECIERGPNKEVKGERSKEEGQLTLVSLQMWHQCSSFPSHSASVAVGEGGGENGEG